MSFVSCVSRAYASVPCCLVMLIVFLLLSHVVSLVRSGT